MLIFPSSINIKGNYINLKIQTISYLPVISKTYERAVQSRLVDLLNANSLFDDLHTGVNGFRSGRSVTKTGIYLVEKIIDRLTLLIRVRRNTVGIFFIIVDL